MKQFRESDKKVDIKGAAYTWSLARTTKEVTKVNEEALKTAGLYLVLLPQRLIRTL